MKEVADILRQYGMSEEHIRPAVEAMSQNPQEWVDFMMRFELGLEKPDPRRALTSALTIGGAYVAGGFIPLAPYMALASARVALTVSVAVTVVALGLFGWIKGHFTGMAPLRSAFQTMLIGGAAAAAAFAIARAIT
jgi:VIT1/CCC1 family predicted Fe2+/Mn2+ transporter